MYIYIYIHDMCMKYNTYASYFLSSSIQSRRCSARVMCMCWRYKPRIFFIDTLPLLPRECISLIGFGVLCYGIHTYFQYLCKASLIHRGNHELQVAILHTVKWFFYPLEFSSQTEMFGFWELRSEWKYAKKLRLDDHACQVHVLVV